ncbi:MAG: hypothetical protein OEY33_08785, partial [Bdellovibrionales bacterium]|nr:hypothetical protein [Bdellovibrionales bacterium]
MFKRLKSHFGVGMAIMLLVVSCITPPEKGEINLDGEIIDEAKSTGEDAPAPIPGEITINTPTEGSYLPLNSEINVKGTCS